MKTSKLIQFLLDIKNRMDLSLKLMIKNKMTMFVLALAILSTCFLLQVLNMGASKKSNIPIGIVNLDLVEETKIDSKKALKIETEGSKELIEGLATIEALALHINTFDVLYKELIEGKIYCLFVIEEGYEEKIMEGDVKNLLTVYQGAEGKTANLVKDIVAGEMMFRICLTKSGNLYDNLRKGETEKFSRQEFEDYAYLLKDSDIFDFKFDTQYVNAEQDDFTADKLNNQLLYRQMIGAIFAMLLSFVILFAATYLPLEQAQGISIRVKLSRMNVVASMLGNLVSICIIVFPLSLIFSGLLCYYAGSFKIFASVMIVTYGYIVLMSILFLLLGKLTKSIFAFQFIGAFVILLFGAGGLCSIVDDIMLISSNLFQFIPNSWFIEEIADILLLA